MTAAWIEIAALLLIGVAALAYHLGASVGRAQEKARGAAMRRHPSNGGR